MSKQAIIDALRTFTCQRPGFELGNYASMADYRSDYRRTLRDRDIALQLLRDIERSDSITANDILQEARSGRLTIEPRGADQYRIGYCTGQYWPVEYRAAVARLCASVLWTWKRENCMPKPGTAPCGSGKAKAGMYWDGKRAVSAGDWLRASFRREYGKAIAGRFFS